MDNVLLQSLSTAVREGYFEKNKYFKPYIWAKLNFVQLILH